MGYMKTVIISVFNKSHNTVIGLLSSITSTRR
jgi:hypothetical protein